MLQVIDGDTLAVHYDGERTLCRLVAPPGERYDPARPFDAPEPGQSGAAEATARLEALLAGRRVRLDFPLRHRDGTIRKRDGFGRLLVTVEPVD